jgi:hypothetical protein
MNTRIAKKILKRAGYAEFVHWHVNNSVTSDRIAAACDVWHRAAMRDARCLRAIDTLRASMLRSVWERIAVWRADTGHAFTDPHRSDRFYDPWRATLPPPKTFIWHMLRDRVKVIDYTKNLLTSLGASS